MTSRKPFRAPILYGITATALIVWLATSLFPVGGRTAYAATPIAPGSQKATFAAGCFWSMQAIFQQLKGVEFTQPGYAGGTTPNPSYEEVESGSTGHAETIDITYDPKVISYRQLLQVLLTVRDPTTLNQQGPDSGTNYRSIIFYRNDAEKAAALDMMKKVTAERVWRDPLVIKVQPYTNFYPAESYHFDYYVRHPDQPYCAMVIAPEIENFRAKYKAWLKS